jgi:tetraacyldisaccharide 4'-kinase
LARADAFVITRAGEVPDTSAVERQLRRYNPSAPIFRARTRVSRQEGCDARAVAFCGLGNPDAFWKTLGGLGVEPLATFTFSDHHQYKCAELRRLARQALDLGAEVLLTTAKDKVNLPTDYAAAIAPLKLCFVEIGLEIEGREELLRLIGKRVDVVPPSGPARPATWLGSMAGTGEIPGDIVSPATEPSEWTVLGE